MSSKMSDKWLEDKYVKQWFQLIGTERTIENYTRDFPKFLDFIKMTPTQIIESRLDDLTTKDILKRKHWENEVIKFMHSLEEQDMNSNTIRGYLRTVRSFFSAIVGKLDFKRGQLNPKPSTIQKAHKEWCPKNEEIRVLYRHAKTPRDRALTLMLYQSGYSEIDISEMNIEEFGFYDSQGKWQLKEDEEQHLYYFRMREKTDIYQCTCVSCECLGDIRMMLKERGLLT